MIQPETRAPADHQPGPRVLTPEYYRRLYTLEQEHGWFRGMRALAGALLDPLAPRRTSWDILDAGCGTGSMLGWLRRFPAARVVGVDLSPDALRFCRQRGEAALALGSVLDLPLRDGRFDLAICADVLQHLPDPVGALSELHRVLRPGGYLLVRTNSGAGTENADDGDGHYRRYGLAELAAQVAAAGFAVERATYGNCLPSLIEGTRHTPGRPAVHASGHGGNDAGLRIRPRSPRTRWLDDALAILLGLEAWYVRALRRPLPRGSSLLLLARRPA